MRPKVLSQAEQGILDKIHLKAEQRSVAIRAGMAARDDFLRKPSTQRVIAALGEGLSLRKTAVRADVSVNTVRKVQGVLNNGCFESV